MGIKSVLIKIPPVRWLAAITRGPRNKFRTWKKSRKPLPSAEELMNHYSSPEYLAHKRDRFELAEEYIALIRKDIGDGHKVADFGCARGLVTREIQKFSRSVMGIDFSKAFLEFARKNIGEENVIQSDLCALPPAVPKDFEVIWCSEVIEHVQQPEKLFQSAHSVLVPKGKFIVTFPPADYTGKNPDWDDIDKHLWCFTKDGIEKIASPWFSVENYVAPGDAVGQRITFIKKNAEEKGS